MNRANVSQRVAEHLLQNNRHQERKETSQLLLANVAQKALLPKPPPMSNGREVGLLLDLPLPAVHATVSRCVQGETCLF